MKLRLIYQFAHAMISEPDNDKSLSESRLPACLEQRADGAIVVTGHRVTLFAVLCAARELQGRGEVLSAVALTEYFPSIAAKKLDEVLEFISIYPP